MRSTNKREEVLQTGLQFFPLIVRGTLSSPDWAWHVSRKYTVALLVSVGRNVLMYDSIY